MFIQIYGRSLCDLCADVCDVLDFHGMQYEYLNLDYMDSDEIVELMTGVGKGATKAPVIIVDRTRMITIDELRDSITKHEEQRTSPGGTSLGSS